MVVWSNGKLSAFLLQIWLWRDLTFLLLFVARSRVRLRASASGFVLCHRLSFQSRPPPPTNNGFDCKDAPFDERELCHIASIFTRHFLIFFLTVTAVKQAMRLNDILKHIDSRNSR